MIFKPECISISLGNECNQRCLYCYSPDHPGKNTGLMTPVFLKAVASAAEMAAGSCRGKNIPLAFGFQGSGEPLLHFDLLKEICSIIKSIAAAHSLRVFSFITSNGTQEAEKYEWLADNFNRICISADGTPEIHSALRPAAGNTENTQTLNDIISILKNRGNMPVCRMTATRLHAEYLFEHIRYLIDEAGFRFVQTEPVYHIGPDTDMSPDPEIFTIALQRAQEYAAGKGATVFYSGYRPDEAHGPYCNILRNVLFINPAGTVSACLFREPESHDDPFSIGYYNDINSSFIIDQKKIDLLAERCTHMPDECSSCSVSGHCTRGCPDVCLIKGDKGITGSVRCRINRLLDKRRLT